VRAAGADLVCLMGARILTKETLAALNRPAINIHSSDPRFMRGAPSVVWEVLDRRKSITLTIHQVTPELDSGDILLQRELPIRFSGGLGATLERTFVDSVPVITRLFAETIVGLKNRRLTPQPFAPGPLRVTPKCTQTLAAEFRCRANTKKAQSS
jgi:methionyl-tRNA formyltransferase